jgi:hypothetical protein
MDFSSDRPKVAAPAPRPAREKVGAPAPRPEGHKIGAPSGQKPIGQNRISHPDRHVYLPFRLHYHVFVCFFFAMPPPSPPSPVVGVFEQS